MKLKELNWYSVFLHTVLIIFSGIILLLINKNSELNEIIAGNAVKQIKAGDKIVNSNFSSLNNNNYDLSFTDESNLKLLFVFSTRCPYCTKNISNWKEIYANYKEKNNLEIYGIATDTLAAVKIYTRENKLPYDVLISTPDFRNNNNIKGVPQTILVDKNGEVKNVWIGQLTNEQFMKIKEELDNIL